MEGLNFRKNQLKSIVIHCIIFKMNLIINKLKKINKNFFILRALKYKKINKIAKIILS
jgi:hypothetical protein